MDPYTGEIKVFAGIYIPADWMLCDGRLLNIADHDVLFSLIGTTYGGDGVNTFALPDFRGRLMVGQGTGVNPALTPRVVGQSIGAESVQLQAANLPLHSHAFNALAATAAASSPDNALTAANTGSNLYTKTAGATGTMTNGTISSAGNAIPASHENMMPSLCVNFIISINGIYPNRP